MGLAPHYTTRSRRASTKSRLSLLSKPSLALPQKRRSEGKKKKKASPLEPSTSPARSTSLPPLARTVDRLSEERPWAVGSSERRRWEASANASSQLRRRLTIATATRSALASGLSVSGLSSALGVCSGREGGVLGEEREPTVGRCQTLSACLKEGSSAAEEEEEKRLEARRHVYSSLLSRRTRPSCLSSEGKKSEGRKSPEREKKSPNKIN